MSREQIKKYIDPKKPVLEIGPFNNPFLSKGEYDVSYADIRDKDGVFNEYAGPKDRSEEAIRPIAQIDYVITESYEKAVEGKRFSAVFSSHVIEHVPDVLGHLIDLYMILEDGGYLVLAIPDKRYTFDHFRDITPFRDALDVYSNPESGVLPRLVFDFSFNRHTCNIPPIFHSGSASIEPLCEDFDRYRSAAESYAVAKERLPAHVHYWVFTYLSFLAFIRDGLRSRLLQYIYAYSAPPEFCGNEFYVVLKKDSSLEDNDEARWSSISKLQGIIDVQEGYSARQAMDSLFDFCSKHESMFIYGCGQMGQHVLTALDKAGIVIKGFVVSDGHKQVGDLCGYPVLSFSELEELQRDKCDETGIFLAMNTRNRAEVVESLRKSSFDVYQDIQ